MPVRGCASAALAWHICHPEFDVHHEEEGRKGGETEI